MFESLTFVALFVANAIRNIGLYFLIGIGLATLIKTQGYDQYIHRLIAKRKNASVPIAVAAGTFSPLCSCGVIPAIAALLTAGVPLAPIMAFWITSPLMDPESFFLTVGLLGSEMAIARLVATLAMGIFAGYATLYLSNKGHLNGQVLNTRTCTCATEKNIQGISTLKVAAPSKLSVFFLEFAKLSVFIGKFIVLAFVLEALIVRFVPMDWVPKILGISNPFGPVLAALLGIPAYASTYASMPIVRGMMDHGMDQGTALSFIIAGAATSIPAMVAVYALVKKRTFFLYVGYSLVGAIAAGYLYRAIGFFQ